MQASASLPVEVLDWADEHHDLLELIVQRLVDGGGTVTLRHMSKLHHIGLGRAHKGLHVKLEWHPFEGLLMTLVAWTRKDVRDATKQTAVSARVSPLSRAAGVGRQDREGRIGSVGLQRAVAA
jgi:hypothetical protein